MVIKIYYKFLNAHNKKIKLTGTAIGEFEFLVLAISFLEY